MNPYHQLLVDTYITLVDQLFTDQLLICKLMLCILVRVIGDTHKLWRIVQSISNALIPWFRY